MSSIAKDKSSVHSRIMWCPHCQGVVNVYYVTENMSTHVTIRCSECGHVVGYGERPVATRKW